MSLHPVKILYLIIHNLRQKNQILIQQNPPVKNLHDPPYIENQSICHFPVLQFFLLPPTSTQCSQSTKQVKEPPSPSSLPKQQLSLRTGNKLILRKSQLSLLTGTQQLSSPTAFERACTLEKTCGSPREADPWKNWKYRNLLPTNFWWFAFERATEVSNYVPLKVNNIITTPHELAYKVKPNARNLFPMSAIGYIRRCRDAETDREIFHSQSLCAIAVGRWNKSSQLLFYHPPTKQTLSSDDFILDESLCSGSAFGLKYDCGLYVEKYYNKVETFSPPTYPPSLIFFIKHKNSCIKWKVITIPDRDITLYTLQYMHTNAIHQHEETDILDHNPVINPDHQNSLLKTFPWWLKYGNNITLFLNNMANLQHGTLIVQDDTYYFRHGTINTNKLVLLKNFTQCAMELITSHQIFGVHPQFRNIHNLHIEFFLVSAVANHVSAPQIMIHEIPSLIIQQSLPVSNNKICDAAYDEES